jgi:hypothetical protein
MRLKEAKGAKEAFIVHLEIRVKRGEEKKDWGLEKKGTLLRGEGAMRA